MSSPEQHSPQSDRPVRSARDAPSPRAAGGGRRAHRSPRRSPLASLLAGRERSRRPRLLVRLGVPGRVLRLVLPRPGAGSFASARPAARLLGAHRARSPTDTTRSTCSSRSVAVLVLFGLVARYAVRHQRPHHDAIVRGMRGSVQPAPRGVLIINPKSGGRKGRALSTCPRRREREASSRCCSGRVTTSATWPGGRSERGRRHRDGGR